MALLTTNSGYALGLFPMPSAQGAEVLSVPFVHTLSANPTANDTAWLGDIPADHEPIAAVLTATDLDTAGSPAITISVGILDDAKTDLDTTWVSASTVGQAGTASVAGVVAAFSSATSTKRSVGLKFPAAATTFAAGSVRVTLLYRARANGV